MSPFLLFFHSNLITSTSFYFEPSKHSIQVKHNSLTSFYCRMFCSQIFTILDNNEVFCLFFFCFRWFLYLSLQGVGLWGYKSMFLVMVLKHIAEFISEIADLTLHSYQEDTLSLTICVVTLSIVIFKNILKKNFIGNIYIYFLN